MNSNKPLMRKKENPLFFLSTKTISNYILGKLYSITLNYALNYTLHPKLSECTLCSLHPKLSHFTLKCYLCYYVWLNFTPYDKHMLLATNLKKLNTLLQNQLKQNLFFFSPYFSVSHVCLSPKSNYSQNLRPITKSEKKWKC